MTTNQEKLEKGIAMHKDIEYKIAQKVLNEMYAQGKIGPLEYAIRIKALNIVHKRD